MIKWKKAEGLAVRGLHSKIHLITNGDFIDFGFPKKNGEWEICDIDPDEYYEVTHYAEINLPEREDKPCANMANNIVL